MSNPFAGPRPLTTKDRLYGRDREVAELYHLLKAERLVLLHSPSGAGKSSLVQAGLLPELAGLFTAWPTARVHTAPPAGYSGNRYAWSVLHSWAPGEAGAGSRLRDFVVGRMGDTNPLLFFDQFEEILRTAPADGNGRAEFFEQLRELLEDRRIWVLFAIREDYLAPLLPYAAMLPTHLRSRYRLDLLTTAQAASAMRLTAMDGGRPFAEQALAGLVNDLAAERRQNPDGTFQAALVPGSHIEPMHLQVVCWRLWEGMDEAAAIDAHAVKEHGDVTAGLAAYYAQAVSKLADGNLLAERAIRDWFGTKLITEWHTRGQVQLEPLASEGLDNETIGKLVNTHLIRAERPDGRTWFELGHDRLIEPVVKDNERWFAEKLEPFQRSAARWARQNRLPGLLLEREELARAEQWAGALTEEERDYLAASREKRETANREAAYNRRIRELLARFSVQEGARLLERGHLSQAVAHMAQAVRLEPGNDVWADWLADALLRNDWWLPEQRDPLPEGGLVLSVDPDGRRAVVALGSRAVIWEAASGAIEDIGAGVAEAVFEVPGERVATLDEAGQVRIFGGRARVETSAETWAELMTFEGGRLLARTEDGAIGLLDAGTGQLRPLDPKVTDAILHPDGKRLLEVWEDENLRMTDGAGNEVAIAPLSGFLSVMLGGDGEWVLVAGKRFTLGAYSAATGEAAGPELAFRDWVQYAAVTPDGKGVATVAEGFAQVWDPVTAAPVGEGFRARAPFSGGRQSPNRKLLALTSLEDTAVVWRLGEAWATGNEVYHKASWGAAGFSGNGNRLVTAGTDGAPWRWRLRDRIAEPLPLGEEGEPVQAAAFGKGGTRVVTAGADGMVRQWNTGTLAEAGVPLPHPVTVARATYDSEGARLVTACLDGFARIWDAETGAELGQPMPHEGQVVQAGFSPDGRLVVTACLEGAAQLWDARTARAVDVWPHDEPVADAAFHPTGEWVVTASGDQAHVWHVATGKRRELKMRHRDQVTNAVYSRDGRWILTASADKTARIWDAETGEAVGRPMGHKDSITRVAFRGDGKRVVTAAGDIVQVWDPTTGERVGAPYDHYCWVNDVQYSEDGRWLLTAATDGRAYLSPGSWGLAGGERLAEFGEAVAGFAVREDSGQVEPLANQRTTLEQVFAADWARELAGQWMGE